MWPFLVVFFCANFLTFRPRLERSRRHAIVLTAAKSGCSVHTLNKWEKKAEVGRRWNARTSSCAGRKTVNRYFGLFRAVVAAHQAAQKALCIGVVEVDESYFGTSRPRGMLGKLKRGRGTLKQPVFGVFERGGRVFTEIIPDRKNPTLLRLIRGRIAAEATAVSDGWRGYVGLVDVGYDRHLRIK